MLIPVCDIDRTCIIQADADALKGPHHIRIGDSGGMILAVPATGNLTSVFYSLDEGSCWFEEEISPDNLPNDFQIAAKTGD